MKELIKELDEAVASGNTVKAELILTQCLNQDAALCIKTARKLGVFRASRHEFESKIILGLVKKIQMDHLAGLSGDARSYLESVTALLELTPSIASRFRKFKKSINARSFKTYLISVESLFRKPENSIIISPIEFGSGRTKEEISEAFSFYYSLLMKKSPPSISDMDTVIETKVGGDFYVGKLRELSAIILFREAEILVDAFPYIATTIGRETIVQSRDPAFERCVRLGYIKAEMQRHADTVEYQKISAQSIKVLAQTYAETGASRFFDFIQGSSSRIRLILPLANEFIQIFSAETAFDEDYTIVRNAMKSFFIDFNTIRLVPIFKSVTLFDLIKFRRFCLFIEFALDAYCKNKGLLNSVTYHRSLVAHFSKEEILNMLNLVCGIPHASEFLEVISSSDLDKEKVFDIQYTPVLKVAGMYMLPIALAGNSNIARNSMLSTRFRFDSDGSIDPLSDGLVEMFAEAKIQAAPQISYNQNGVYGEIDVIARIEDVLFAFECKNSLLPCNVFELRQSYDYIQKGFEQLSRLRQFAAYPEFLNSLGQKSGLNLKGVNRLVTCVVTGNRMFDGWRESTHSVRCVYEIANVITGGDATMSVPKDYAQPAGPRSVVRIKTWKGASLTAADLIDYLENDSFHKPFFDTMVEHNQVVKFGAKTLKFKSCSWDATAYYENRLKDSIVEP